MNTSHSKCWGDILYILKLEHKKLLAYFKQHFKLTQNVLMAHMLSAENLSLQRHHLALTVNVYTYVYQ